MESLRKRISFQSLDDADVDGDDNRILDEQEQEALIKTLRQVNNASNKQYLLALRVILVLSLLLQCFSFRDNPLHVIAPPFTSRPLTIPFSGLFTVLSLVLHLNLVFLASVERVKLQFRVSHFYFRPLSYQLSYAFSAVAPTLSLYLGRPWQSTIWWSTTAIVVLIAHSIMVSIDEGNKNVSELESMKYVAPGA